ncbi:PalH/RIM21-domain-containing protein [Lipomyces kononenkoae]|uniref:PalH/RIM21-domain-containing protein n=1 Tax=Lipomyces kononenkoae TaxID=34357 RepID=A0ACC3T671_LIPKO
MVADLWRNPITTYAHTPLCTPYTLPAGVVVLASTTQTVFPTAVFSPLCTPSSSTIVSSLTPTSSLKNPFYSSTIPIAYTVGGTTVLAWVLLLLLLITPQTRPYLQKLATFSVALSLTIALRECSAILERQYDQAYEDAEELRAYIDGGFSLNIFRVVSYVFLWLAQVQTLIRLFPRHREKKIIKWLGLALMIVDATFWSLQSFLPTRVGDQKSFRDAIPALAYLFRIILSLLYAAYVVYYSISKRVYAYHIKNLILALLSLVAVLTPIIFFLLDVSRQWIAGWGDFVGWVGAAAASVVVWEWVERIEFLESKMQETGVLGRQVFEEEMLETGTSRGARASRDVGRSRRWRDGGSGAGSTLGRRRPPRRRVDDGSFTGGLGHASVAPSSEHMSRRRSLSTRDPATRENGSDSSASYNEEAQEDTHTAEAEGTTSARTKEGRGIIADGLRGSRRRRRRPREGDSHSNADNESLTTFRPSIGVSIMGLLSNARTLFFSRPLSRATTGTGATSYRVSSSSIMEDDGIGEEVRVKHFHPLKRGLSRSTHSSSPASFVNTAELGSVSSQLCSRNLPPQSHSPEAESAATNSAPAIGVRRNSPVPSVSFREDSRRPVAPSCKNPSPLPRVSEDRIDGIALDRSREVSSRQSTDRSAIQDNSADEEDDDDDDYDTDYIVYGEAANAEAVLRSNQSIHARVPHQDSLEPLSGGDAPVEQPPAFDRLPGFKDGDYWDEKDPRYRPAFMNTNQQTGAIATESSPQTSITGASRSPSYLSPSDPNPDHNKFNAGGAQNARVTLEPADTSSSRRIIERLTGARDWIVTVHNESRDESH